jgi:hypothetical protein
VNRPRFYSLSPWNDLSGAPLCALDHLRFLDPSSENSLFLLPRAGSLEARAAGYRVPTEVIPLFTGARSARIPPVFSIARTRASFVRRLAALLRERPGILHIHSLAPHLPYALLAARLARCPAAVTVHEPWNGSNRLRFYLSCVRKARCPVVFLSESARRACPPLPRNPVAVVSNAFPLPPVPPTPRNPVPVVALVAALSARKGVDIALRIALEIRKRGIPAKFLVIGPWIEDGLRRSSLDFVRENHLEDTVSFPGPVPDPDAIYPTIDILLVPSRRDPYPRVVMEALSYARPVVASDVDGIPDMLGPLAADSLAPPCDIPAFTDRLLPLLRDSSLRAARGTAARARAESLFSPEAYRSAILSLYQGAGFI